MFLAIVFTISIDASMAASLKISTEYDEIAKEPHIQSGKLLVCQPRSAGKAPCADLRLSWRHSAPEIVLIQIEIIKYVNMTSMFFSIDGTITEYAADSPTDFDYDESPSVFGYRLGKKSSNVFAVQLSSLKAVTESEKNGVVRITGANSSMDFDFYRKASFGKLLPADKLREFVVYVENKL
jgi:hypothetical protein